MKIKIAENIKHYRRKKDWTQQELAEKLCVSLQVVSRWETGVSYPDLELIPIMSDLFGVSSDDLIGAETASRGYAPVEITEEIDNTQDKSRQYELLKKAHRDYPKDDHILYRLCFYAPDIENKRKYTEELLSDVRCNSFFKTSAINDLIKNETDEELLKKFAEKYTTTTDINRAKIMFNRYYERKEADKYLPLGQLLIFNELYRMVFYQLDTCGTQDESSDSAPDTIKAILKIINLLSGAENGFLIKGNGKPDAWIMQRIYNAKRLACLLLKNGRIDEAVRVIEEMTDLCEAFFRLEDKSELSFNTPVFSHIKATVAVSFDEEPIMSFKEEIPQNHKAFYVEIRPVNGCDLIFELGLRYQMVSSPFRIVHDITNEIAAYNEKICDHPSVKNCIERIIRYDEIIDE